MSHLRDTIRPVRQDGDTSYGVSALGPVQVLPGGGILPADITDLYPGADLTKAAEDIGCFNSRYGDCDGKVANCPTLQAVVLCEHHHNETHGQQGYAVERGNFKCRPPAPSR